MRELGAQRCHLVELDRAVEAPRQLGGGGDAVEVEVAPQQRLGLDAAGADERDELGELGGVRVLVPLRERELRGRGEDKGIKAVVTIAVFIYVFRVWPGKYMYPGCWDNTRCFKC